MPGIYLAAILVSAGGTAALDARWRLAAWRAPRRAAAAVAIGTLFFLNFVSAVLITAGLIAPLARLAGRHADAIRALFAVGGIGLGLLSLAALFVSESSGLFGFVEHGYRTPIALAIVAEAAAVVLLGIFLAATVTGRLNSNSNSN